MRRARILTAFTALVIGVGMLTPTPADADRNKPDPTPGITVLTTAVEQPYGLAVRHGKVFVADSVVRSPVLRGQIGTVNADGTLTTLISPAEGVRGLALSRNGKFLAYSYLIGAGPPAQTIGSGLIINGPGGSTITADALAYESANNPDHGIEYGIDPASATPCVIDELRKVYLPAYYNGINRSAAYSVAAHGKDFILADTGANTLLQVTRSGKISTLAVLPPQPMVITPELAAAHGLADCVVGLTYHLEAAPSDVEVGRDGQLYVTTLANVGGGIDLGPRGSLYRVNPRDGKATLLASGLAGPTNLAISRGRIYITELDAGRISTVSHGKVSGYLPLPGALAIEAGRDGSLYASTLYTGPASIVKIDTHRGWRH